MQSSVRGTDAELVELSLSDVTAGSRETGTVKSDVEPAVPLLERQGCMDNYIIVDLVNGVIFIGLNSQTYADDAIWPVVVFACNMILAYGILFLFVRKHMVWLRAKEVVKSLLVWQVVALVLVSSLVQMIYAQQNRKIQVIFIQMTIFCVDVAAPILDMTNCTSVEAKCILGILAFGTLGLIYMANFSGYDDYVIYSGIGVRLDAQNREVHTGRITKNGLRSSLNFTLLFLLLNPLFMAFLSKNSHEKLNFVKYCLLKGDLPPHVSARKHLADPWLGCAWAFVVIWIPLQVVTAVLTDGAKVTPDSLVWPVTLNFLATAALIACLGLYFKRNVVQERVPPVLLSFFTLQIIFLCLVYLFVCVLYTPWPGYTANAFARSLFVSVLLCSGPALDACNATPFEIRSTLSVALLVCLLNIAACTFMYTDVIIFQGFRVTMTVSGDKVWSGQYTVNGVCINVLITVSLLVLNGLCSSFTDAHCELLYFVKKAMHKDQLRKLTWRERRKSKVNTAAGVVGAAGIGSAALGAMIDA